MQTQKHASLPRPNRNTTSVTPSSRLADTNIHGYFCLYINNASVSADAEPILVSLTCTGKGVRSHSLSKWKGEAGARCGCSQLLLCSLKAGFTSSLLTEIPTTSLPPRRAGDIVSAPKGSSVAINLNKWSRFLQSVEHGGCTTTLCLPLSPVQTPRCNRRGCHQASVFIPTTLRPGYGASFFSCSHTSGCPGWYWDQSQK